MDQTTFTDRPPRIQPELPLGERQIPKPPGKSNEGRARLVEVGLPLITIIGYIFVAAVANGANSLGLLIPMALSVVASVGFSIYTFRKEQQRRAEIERSYANRLVELNKEMHISHDLQRRFYRYNYPNHETLLQIVRRARQQASRASQNLRSDARIWERRTSDDDFGVVRLGMGTLPSTVEYTLADIEDYTDPQARAALKLATDSRFVPEIPVIISLRQPPERDDMEEEEDSRKKAREALKMPTAHAIGVAGEREGVYDFARAILSHYAVFHAHSDARLYLLANERREWGWIEDLPHCKGDDQNRFHCFTSEIKTPEGERGFDDDDGGELEQFLEGIRKVLAQRKIRLQEREENESASDPTLPFLLVVVDLLDIVSGTEGLLQGIEADAALSILIEEGNMLGASVIFLVPDRGKVPSGCRAVIEIEKTSPATNSQTEQGQRLHFRYAEIGVNSPHYVGEADIATPDQASKLARDMAEVNVRQSSGANLTNAVPFLDLMGHTSLHDLTAAAWLRWQSSAQPRYANWLRVKLGMMSGNKPRTMVFSAKRDGVHGMVAGSTGSGKSELLISMIAGMAITYAPSVLNFVLVDYKGGGAFKEFIDLPHCVDIITNLAADGVTRMFTAIQSEMKRRQALNAETGTKNIVEYRQKGLHLTHQPYPFLFIIIDEFAEMIADRAEYKTELESISRVGRAQGVSMILAAQRPSGVTDQMRSNIKFRICLRVETPGESREMLRRADAAFLPTGLPGRGYLQVGNEEIELIQVAYTGDRYVDPKNNTANSKVLWPDRHGGAQVLAQDQQPPELYKAIIDALNAMAKANKLPPQHAPWPGFLPKHLALSETLISENSDARTVTSKEYLVEIDRIMLGRPQGHSLTLNPSINDWLAQESQKPSGWIEPRELDWQNYAMRPVVGLIDNPYAARQLPLILDLPRGHVVILGASGSGKTSFIRTLIVSLAATHSPDCFHAYVLDLGGRSLGVLAELPHVGAVVIPDEEGYEERVEQILREIQAIADRRKLTLSNASVTDIYQYNQAHPEAPEPAIVMAIDNFGEFVESFGGMAEGDNVETVLTKFIELARQSKPYGIHFVVSVSQMGTLSNQLYSLFSERYTLRLTDPTEYRSIVGGNVAEIADIPGRGYTRVDRQPLAFQVALPIDLRRENSAEPANEIKEITQLAQHMQQYIASSGRTFNLPVRVDALPKAVLFKHMLAREHNLSLDATFLPKLTAITRQKWADSTNPDLADWLKVAIGVVSGNRPRLLELEAKKDGVHGMVAGGTGSGKSELLMTLIVGLALNYDPSVLNFVLVDYKGGGAFKPFEKLPHCVDTITNLNITAVKRMFTAINAEMRRRQRLNAETGTKDIVEYRQKGLHKSHQPYPHLFIIIDEYAEMISTNPEFGQELDSITRVGRAQGVNLLLASQRPTGVSDQMRANIKLRICLRVEGADTSREMLRRPDAAYLPNGMPGRGYLQVGNEQVELMQLAYTGETYPFAEVAEGGEKPKFYDVIVKLANDLLKEARPLTPWPPFLPVTQTFATPLRTRYLDPTYEALITQGRGNRLTLNPFLQTWLDGKEAWQPVDWNKTAMRAIVGLLDDPYNARQLPLLVDFTRGHAVIFGASGWGKTTMLRSLILSLAATHSPNEFQAHVLDLGGRNLEVLRALPHVGTVVMPDERGYEERMQQLWRELSEIIDTRKRLFSTAGVSTLIEYNENNPGTIEPAVLMVIDNFGEFIETFGSGTQADDENSLFASFIALARQGRAYGFHVVITCNRLNVLSSKLYSLFTERYTLRLSDPDDYSGIVGSSIPEIEEIPGRGYTRIDRLALSFQVALPPGAVDEQGQARGEARQIRAIGERMTAYLGQAKRRFLQPLRIDALPKSSSFRQVLADERNISQESGRFLDGLKASTRDIWEHNASTEHADWLQVTLGVSSGNRLRTLRLEAKKDGVHGMVAGGTGAGKSELLMTLIVGLALNYPPDILNFVLVDYKGGGAFKPFENLPHCVDIVTNLNTAAVERMFTAINAEIRRRQALNAETGTKDIVDYRARGLHKTREPYPHLFVIIDEYAEMIDQNDEYLRQIESITRVGRAQGVNLLLASQQPKGVTDQMRANIKLRLCLRVEQMDTSREMLRRPDAALLPNGMPGRGYLQIGNENLELIQVSYTGETQPDDRAADVLWPDRAARTTADEEPPKLFDMAVKIASELVHGARTPKPWPAFLPERFSLETPLVDAQRSSIYTLTTTITDWINGDTEALWPPIDWRGGVLRPVVGLVDDPAEARQDPLAFDLGRNHLAVFGDAGMGKTTLLRTVMVSLAANYGPDDLHMYVLDMGGRNFRSLETLPHVGAALYADDETFDERLQRLLEFLNHEIEERQQRISAADSSNLYEYNERFPNQTMPAIVLLIDNFAALQENYEILVETSLMPLVRRSLSVGITLVLATNLHTHIPSRLYSLFGERITLKQTNTDNYMDIVGRGAVELGDTPGRGYIRKDRRPLMFHTALPVGVLAEDGRAIRPEAEELRQLGAHMLGVAEQQGWSNKPDAVNVLPEQVPLSLLLREAVSSQPKRMQAVLGRSENLQPALFDLRRSGPHFLIVGPPLSGKTTTLYAWVLSLADRYPPDQARFVLIDLQRKFTDYGGSRSLAELPHVLSSLTEVEQIEALLLQLNAECAQMAAAGSEGAIFVVIDNFDDFSDETENKHSLGSDIAALARRFGRDGLHFIVAGTPEGSANELKRRIQGANYGIGLRTASAVETLRVMRTPPALRNKELPIGRGFIVKSGQTTMIQVANPYTESSAAPSGPEDDDERRIRALDGWVEQLRTKYTDQQATWQASAETETAPSAAPPAERQKITRMLAVLQHGMRKELEILKQGNGAHKQPENGEQESGDGEHEQPGNGTHELITAKLMQFDIGSWNNPEVLVGLLKDLYVRQQEAIGLDAATAKSMTEYLDDESLLLALEGDE
jgi:DNA segregation ATPase FtsK/SpoIIIE, S-DNA-T family